MSKKFFSCPAILVFFLLIIPSTSFALQNLGMVGVKSTEGRYLQAHDDNGEMHASNQHRNEEETWFLWEVDKTNHIYALQNWRNGKFMSKHQGTICSPATSTTLSNPEKWVMVKGTAYGVVNAVAFRSVVDGTYLGANKHGHDNSCGGEVGAGSPAAPQSNGSWPGWWVLEPATQPSPGKNVWNTAGGAIQGVAVQLAPIALNALMSIL